MHSVWEEPQPDAVRSDAGTYFVVSGDAGTWLVSTAMARHIEATLDSQPPADWVAFVDIVGSRVRLRCRQVHAICQSTPEQRADDRAHSRALDRERRADRRWGDEE